MGKVMNPVRLLGLAVAAVGIFFVSVGIESTHAPLERLAQALADDVAHDTILYITAGLAAFVAGTVLAVFEPQ